MASISSQHALASRASSIARMLVGEECTDAKTPVPLMSIAETGLAKHIAGGGDRHFPNQNRVE